MFTRFSIESTTPTSTLVYTDRSSLVLRYGGRIMSIHAAPSPKSLFYVDVSVYRTMYCSTVQYSQEVQLHNTRLVPNGTYRGLSSRGFGCYIYQVLQVLLLPRRQQQEAQ